MAKFLPFVVEKSTPLFVYQTLISRSKGLNSLLVTSIFYLVVETGIATVRDVASKLPDMPMDQLYEALITSFPSSRISDEFFKKIQAVGYYVKKYSYDDISEELKEYELKDVMNFLLVMTLLKHSGDYSSLPFHRLFNGESETKENNLLQSKLFSNDGEIIEFENKESIAAYIHYYSLLSTDTKPKPIKVVFIKETKDPYDSSERPFDGDTG